NALFATSLGKTSEARLLFAALGVAADVLALVLPAAAWRLWAYRRYQAASVAWSIWVVTLAVTLLAAVGFASLNISDVTASRNKVVSESVGWVSRVARLRAERAGITETRPVGAIEIEIQRAQPTVPGDVWKATRACTDITLGTSAS